MSWARPFTFPHSEVEIVPKDYTGPTTGKGGAWKETSVPNAPRQASARPALSGRMDVATTIDAVLTAGGYFSLGETSDGGAILLRVLYNGRKLETYCHTDTELAEALLALRQRFPLPSKDQRAKSSPPAPQLPLPPDTEG